MALKRPAWAEKTVAMQEYYDHYWGLPVHDDQQLFEMLSLELFQAGLTWQTIWQRRLAFEKAFNDFEIDKVAVFDISDIDRLCQNEQIIRNRRKIEAVINNAQVINRIQQTGQTFDDYVWRFINYQPQRLVLQKDEVLPAKTVASENFAKQLKKDGFKFMGPTIAYSFMTAVGLVNARLE